MLRLIITLRSFLFRLALLILSAILVKHIFLPWSSSTTMSPPPDASEVASSLLREKGFDLHSIQVLQSLWAGYGQICRITARPPASSASTSSTPQEPQSYILKLIAPPPVTRADDEGHIRKILSYQVEQYFYTHLAPQMPPSIPVARAFSSIHAPQPDGTLQMAMLLTDLKQTFPIAGEKRDVLTPTQVDAALDWLSHFHAFWWSRVAHIPHDSLVHPPLEQHRRSPPPTNSTVWLNGGYTYLATRQKEYATLLHDYDSEWNLALTDWEEGEHSISHFVAAALAPPRKPGMWTPTAPYMTLIHGDVKSENLFTTASGTDAAFYDFQYVGLGLGVCDLAKLFTCSVPLSLLISHPPSPFPRELDMQDGEKALLQRYLQTLTQESGKAYDWAVFVRHWETALVDWLRFQAGWGFWGNTAWLEARVRWILRDEGWKEGVLGLGKMGGMVDI